MKTFYTIVSISPNPQFSEKLNVGLLCVSDNTTFFRFSPTKLSVLKKLLSTEAFKLAQATLKGIERSTVRPNRASDFIRQESVPPNAVAEPYISYLSRYNNNLVQFAKPVSIDISLNQDTFNQLFNKYIFEEVLSYEVLNSAIQAPTFNAKRREFRTSAKKYANINFHVTKDVVQDLIAPVKVDVFGKNGAFVSGQAFDFTKKVDTLISDITSYVYLSEHTHKLAGHAKSFALGDEPSKEDKEHHTLWKNIYQSDLIELIPFDESEQIIDFMRRKGVEPVQ